MTIANKILEYASNHPMFGIDELVMEYGENSRNSLTCILSRLVKTGKIARQSKGVYALPKRNVIFNAYITEQEKAIGHRVASRPI